MYAVIRNGRGLMASYGERTTEDERWAIVHYIRQLQRGAGAAPAGPADASEPAAAADGGEASGSTQERD
jgi:mono/diheme cytochrome c family protein